MLYTLDTFVLYFDILDERFFVFCIRGFYKAENIV